MLLLVFFLGFMVGGMMGIGIMAMAAAAKDGE